MSTSSGSTRVSNINARQINSDEAIRNRQKPINPTVLVDDATGEMLVDEEGRALTSQEGDI